MNDFTPWLRPTLLGPFLTTWGFATLAFLTSGLVLPNGERLDGWLLTMLSLSFLTSGVVVGLLTADLALLRLRMRKLPTGGAAWLSSLLAPVAVWLAWTFFGWGDGGSVPETVFMIVWPFLGMPLALRFVLGRP